MSTKTENKMINILLNIIKSLALPLVLYFIFKLILGDTFGSLESLYIILQQTIVSALISLGMLLNMTIGIWDFSAGSIVIMVGIFLGHLANAHNQLSTMVIATIVIGMVIGFVNATLYTLCRVPSVVVTISLLLIYESIASTYKGGLGVLIAPELALLGRAPWIFVVALFSGIAMYIIYSRTELGFGARAIGSNEIVAKQVGINPRKIKFFSFFIAGFLYSVAGLVNLSYGTALSPGKNMSTLDLNFNAMIAVFIAMYMAHFCNPIMGVFIGNFSMKLLSAGLVATGVDGTWQKVIIGVFLIFFMSFNGITEKIEQKNAINKSFNELNVNQDTVN